MDPQRYIVEKIEAEMTEIGEFSWLKFISETSMLAVENYPALLVEDDKPYGTENMMGDGVNVTRIGEYIISLIVPIPNLKDMTRDDYKASKKLAIKYIEQVESFICSKWKENASITEEEVTMSIIGLGFEKAEMGFVEIDSQPQLILQMPVTARYILS